MNWSDVYFMNCWLIECEYFRKKEQKGLCVDKDWLTRWWYYSSRQGNIGWRTWVVEKSKNSTWIFEFGAFLGHYGGYAPVVSWICHLEIERNTKMEIKIWKLLAWMVVRPMRALIVRGNQKMKSHEKRQPKCEPEVSSPKEILTHLAGNSDLS